MEELTSVIKESFDAVQGQLNGLTSEARGLKEEMKTVKTGLEKLDGRFNGLEQKVGRHLEVSDDRYFELQEKDTLHEKWFSQVGKATNITFEPPRA